MIDEEEMRASAAWVMHAKSFDRTRTSKQDRMKRATQEQRKQQLFFFQSDLFAPTWQSRCTVPEAGSASARA